MKAGEQVPRRPNDDPLLIRITDVLPSSGSVADGCHGQLDLPVTGSTSNVYHFNVEGWVAGSTSRATSVDLVQEGSSILSVPVTTPRPDVASAFPSIRGADSSGFRGTVSALELKPRFELTARARFANGAEAPVARIRGQRKPLSLGPTADFQPVAITTIGRSGSKWLAWLLSCHPQIFGFAPLTFEPRVATYWMSVLREFGQPRSYLRQVHTDSIQDHRWWLPTVDVPLPAPLDADVAAWLGRDGVESLAAMCRLRIEEFYTAASASGVKPAPRYFVEKFLLDPTILQLASEIYPGYREVILVRDFRDRVASVLAWDAKRGEHGFGRDGSATDVEYVMGRARTEALSLLRRSRERAPEAILVRYEDLVLSPKKTLIQVLTHLGVDSRTTAVQMTLDRAHAERDHMESHRTTSDPVASIGRWQRDLSPELKAACQDALAPVLAEFGYEPSSEGARERV